MSQFQKPDQQGVPEKLAACPESPNCVCSQTVTPDHGIEPLPVPAGMKDPLLKLKEVLKKRARTKITLETENYLRVECTSLIMRFVDDVEFLYLPGEKLIHVRSASRVGYSDFGVNRKRVEEIRQEWMKVIPQEQK